MASMKNLLAIVAAVMALPACIIESSDDPFCGDGFLDSGEACDDGGNASGDGCSAVCTIESVDTALITANWRFENVATNAQTQCPSGFDTAALYSQEVDLNGTALGQPIIDLFNCADGTGTTAPLPPGLYQSWIAITDTDGSTTYAQSTSAYVDVTTADQTFSATILNDGGYFALTWNLIDSSNAARTCEQVAGITGVGVLSTSVANSNNFFDDKFTCADYYGITGGLLAGVYTVAVDALGAGDASIGRSPVLTNRLILDKNRVTDLGNITITLD